MAPDDLNAPLGRNTPEKSWSLPANLLPQMIAGALGLFVVAFFGWVLLVDDPYGGEPRAVVSAKVGTPAEQRKAGGETPGGTPDIRAGSADPAAARGSGQTITIIDGSSGKRQEVVVPGSGEARKAGNADSRLLESTRHGPIPRIGLDGARPSEIYARKSPPNQANPDGPRIALVIGGLGISATATADALSKLPGPVTFAFPPYGSDLDNLTARARGEGHEVLLQVSMEPFDYPDNDPGPQTLLTALSAEQNVDRLHWMMSRFAGYVGLANFMGARFSASDQAIAPVLREVSKRGLIYLDDSTSPRSLAGQIAGANKVPFAKAEIVVDTVPTPGEIDKALTRLEALARERGAVVGFGSALPVTIDRVSKWAKAAAARGVVLVPITAVTVKPKSS
ncbi:MAG: divergent polysaccharide deacetylase family protein [Pseudorhodoplanes sp.]